MSPSKRESVSRYLFCMAIFCCLSPAALASTAAESDWQASAAGQCRGQYIQPEISSTAAVQASADSAMHVADHSTTLNGNIEINHQDQQLKADFATIDAATEIYTAEGDISLRQKDMLLRGERITGNLFDETAVIDSASFLLHKNRVRGTATKIAKSANNDLNIENGSFTTCEPDSNTWQVTGKSIELKGQAGYGIARDVTLKIKDVPVAYFPWFRFPIDDRRQSGFLMPSIGQDSDGGTDIAIPYYFNIKPNLDATYTLRNMHKRGLMHEGELRYLNKRSENLIALAYLPSDDVYDDREIITPGVEFSEQDRWLAHITHRGRFGNWTSRVNFTSVSDIDYFHDLGSFTNTRTRFNRALSQSDRPAILRTGSLQYDMDNWGARVDLRSFQELNQIQSEQYAVLPRLSLYGQKRLSRFKFSGQIQATEFDKSDSSPDGARIVADGRIELPLRNSWGFINPSVRTIHRDYDLTKTDPLDRDSASLTTTLSSIDMGLILERETEIRGQSLRQTLEPRLFYLHAEEDFQSDLPSFDSTPMTPSYDSLFRDIRYTGYDRIGDANQVALGVTTRFYSSDGVQRFAASLGQAYHLDDREVNFGNTPGVDPRADTSPIFARLKTRYRNIDINAQYEFDSDAGRSNRGYISLRYRNAANAIFNFTYAMTDSSVQRDRLLRSDEETDLSFLWPITSNINVIGRWNYAWDNEQTIESLLGLEYNDCCWKARLVFRRNLEEPRQLGLVQPGGTIRYITDRRADSGIYFEFQLRGLASLGGRLDSMLQDSIPGFFGER